MPTIHVRVDQATKSEADALFGDLGLDTPTAVRMFLAASLENDGFPFQVKRVPENQPSAGLLEAIEDVRLKRNLYGPFPNAAAAIKSMLED